MSSVRADAYGPVPVTRLQQAATAGASRRAALRWVSLLALAGTAVTLLWIYLVQRRQRERERQRVFAQQQVDRAEHLQLEEELRRRGAEQRQEETERKLLEQRLATQAAERRALELKSQLYASIGIMAGSYAHNIKNLLVRPNDLLRRCLEADGLSGDQAGMLHEVRQTLGTVTERLQQILRTVRRDPSRSELTRARPQRRGARDGAHLEGAGARQVEAGRWPSSRAPEPLLDRGRLCRICSRRSRTCCSTPATPPSRCATTCATQARRDGGPGRRRPAASR